MLKSLKNIINFSYGLMFFVTLFISIFFPILATITTIFSVAGKNILILKYGLKISGASLILHMLWWLLALMWSIVYSLISKPNITFAVISGICYTVVSILSVAACLLLYKTGIIPE